MKDFTEAFDRHGVPEHIRGGITRYLNNGILPGGFMQAVICNDLFEAFARADTINRNAMFNIVSFFFNEVPAGAWGSKEAMNKWMEHGHKILEKNG